MEEHKEPVRIEEVEFKPKAAPLIADLIAEGERALEQAQKAMALAEEQRIVITPEPTLWEKIKEKTDGFLNIKGNPVTNSVGVGAALFCFYEAVEYYLQGNTLFSVAKVGQGAIALVVGIISKDPKPFSQP